MKYAYAEVVIKVKCRHIVLYGPKQNIYRMKFIKIFK